MQCSVAVGGREAGQAQSQLVDGTCAPGVIGPFMAMSAGAVRHAASVDSRRRVSTHRPAAAQQPGTQSEQRQRCALRAVVLAPCMPSMLQVMPPGPMLSRGCYPPPPVCRLAASPAMMDGLRPYLGPEPAVPSRVPVAGSYQLESAALCVVPCGALQIHRSQMPREG